MRSGSSWVTSSFQLRIDRFQIKGIIEALLQLSELRKKRAFPLQLLGVVGEVLHLHRVLLEVIKPRDLRSGIEDQLPTIIDHGALQIKVGAID